MDAYETKQPGSIRRHFAKAAVICLAALLPWLAGAPVHSFVGAGQPSSRTGDATVEKNSKDRAAWRSRPEPGILTRQLETGGLWRMFSSQPASEPRQPVRVKLARFSTLLEEEQEVSWLEVTGSLVNMREGPDIGAEVVGQFRRGTRMKLLDRRDGWSLVTDLRSGVKGWMSSDYVAETKVKPGASTAGAKPGISPG